MYRLTYYAGGLTKGVLLRESDDLKELDAIAHEHAQTEEPLAWSSFGGFPVFTIIQKPDVALMDCPFYTVNCIEAVPTERAGE